MLQIGSKRISAVYFGRTSQGPPKYTRQDQDSLFIKYMGSMHCHEGIPFRHERRIHVRSHPRRPIYLRWGITSENPIASRVGNFTLLTQRQVMWTAVHKSIRRADISACLKSLTFVHFFSFLFVSFRNEPTRACSVPVSYGITTRLWKDATGGVGVLDSENNLLPLGLGLPAPSPRWRRSPKIPCWNVRSVSITIAPGEGPSCWIANTLAAQCASGRWRRARRTWGAPGAGASPGCPRASPCRSSPTTPRSSRSLPSRTRPSTLRSSSNFPAMGATCCPCPSPRSERCCPETWAAACCPGASRSPSPWWPSPQNSSPCKAGLPRRRRRRSQTGGVWSKALPGPGCALWSWWPASWSSFWASCCTTCLAFLSASLWYPVAERGRGEVSRGCQLGGWAGVGDGVAVSRWGATLIVWCRSLASGLPLDEPQTDTKGRCEVSVRCQANHSEYWRWQLRRRLHASS